MKIGLGIMAATLFFATAARAGVTPTPVTKFREPFLLVVRGKAFVTPSSGKKTAAKKNDSLRERALLETEGDSMIVVALAANETLTVGPSSRVSIPVISWEDGAVERIELEKGQMRLTNLTSRPRLVLTPLTRDPYSEADLIFNLDMKVPALTLSVLEGRASFRGRENEESLPLGRDEEATFTGSTENGELVEDVLLAGRRVIRGKMSEKRALPESTRELWAKAESQAKTQDAAARAKAKKEKERRGAICEKPSGRFNECSWTCEHNPGREKKKCRMDLPAVKCVRRRCNADGQWGDALELTAQQSPCGVKPLVSACDY